MKFKTELKFKIFQFSDPRFGGRRLQRMVQGESCDRYRRNVQSGDRRLDKSCRSTGSDQQVIVIIVKVR